MRKLCIDSVSCTSNDLLRSAILFLPFKRVWGGDVDKNVYWTKNSVMEMLLNQALRMSQGPDSGSCKEKQLNWPKMSLARHSRWLFWRLTKRWTMMTDKGRQRQIVRCTQTFRRLSPSSVCWNKQATPYTNHLTVRACICNARSRNLKLAAIKRRASPYKNLHVKYAQEIQSEETRKV